MTRSNPFTFLFIGMNVGVFVLMWLAGGMSAMEADERVLVGFGAKVNRLIAEEGQYWRLVTSIFIHIGFIHLFFNCYALMIVGQEIERLYGSTRFVLLYLLTGIAGSIASYLYTPNTSAGASGAIFGLFGVMATFAFRYRKEIPDMLSKEIKRRVIPLILINLSFGVFIKQIDNAAHIGGLVAGVLLALIIPYKRPQEKLTPVVWRSLMILSLGVIATSIAIAARDYDGPPLRLSNFRVNPQSNRTAFMRGLAEGHKALTESFGLFSEALTSTTRSVDTGPALAAAERGIQIVNAMPDQRDEADQFKKRLLELIEEQKAMIEQHSSSGTINRIRAAEAQNRIVEKSNRLIEDFNRWAGNG